MEPGSRKAANPCWSCADRPLPDSPSRTCRLQSTVSTRASVMRRPSSSWTGTRCSRQLPGVAPGSWFRRRAASMIEPHHVVLYDAEPPGFGILSRAGGIFLALQCLALLDIRLGAVESRLFVVPEDETNRAVGLHVWRAEYTRELHDERRAGSVVVRGFAPTDSVHVSAHDVHLVRMRGADLGAVDFLTLSGNT